jgi:hypothetical protein
MLARSPQSHNAPVCNQYDVKKIFHLRGWNECIGCFPSESRIKL